MFSRLYYLASTFSSLLRTDLCEGLIDLLEADQEQSRGLQPVQPHILQPQVDSFVMRTYFGTWQRHDFPVLEKAFMHFRQQPFFGSNFSSFQYEARSPLFIFGLYSGSSPRLRKSSTEQPLQPQVWHPFCPIYVRLWFIGTTQTHDFLPFYVCLHFLQQYRYLFFLS